jgi:DNA-binding NarL/FixJ family response regulator
MAKNSVTARIVVADDHDIVREGVRTLVERARRGWEICGESPNGSDAVQAVRALKPDIVILDLTMPVMNGLEAAARIRELKIGCRVLIFTMHESGALTAEVQEAGAHGCVLKSQASRDLIRAIDTLLAGGTFFGASQHSFSHVEAGRRLPPATKFLVPVRF